MKKIKLLLLLFVVVIACSKEEPLPTTGNIRGKITDAQNSSPLRDVNVEIGGNSYTTGSDGSYFFNDLPERSYTVSVSKSGYIADSKSVMVRADQTALADFVMSKNLPTAEPTNVTITNEEGSKSVTLRNTQAEPIGFSTQSSKPWITVSPSSGTIAGNSQTIISISIDFNEIGFGTLNENVIINVSGSSLTVPITVVKGEPSFINILEPMDGGIYAPQESMQILWESNLSGTVDIGLLRSGSSSIFKTVQENAQNNSGGGLNWTIPDIDPGEYRIKIISKQEIGVSDITGNFFIGNDPSIPFIERDQVFSYVEDQEAGYVIGTLSASDDIGIERFEFVSGNTAGYFAISNAGKITLTSQGASSPANDYEQTPNEFTLQVRAIDADDNQSDSVEVIIRVVDFDDEPPVIEANQSFTYSEGRPANFVLGKVEASDDVGIASFEIVSGNNQGYFTINGSGEVRLTTAGLTSPANDYEQEPNAFTIGVKATDQSGNASSVASISIIVVDSDDVAPVIEPNQTFSYEERKSEGYVIGTVAASDNVAIASYQIVSGNNQGYFTITSAGILKLTSTGAGQNAASNDYETQPNGFSLGIVVLDAAGNTSDTAIVTINVLDVDDAGFNGRFFKDSNGVTIKCEECSPGDRGTVDGVIYTAVSEEMLREMIANDEDVTKVVTSLVTTGERLFFQKANFNQDIGHWDTSNFTSTVHMFSGSFETNAIMQFNQDISAWDTSKVTNMDSMFLNCRNFNQPIGSWDTSSVVYMNFMFRNAAIFNQDISDWDVSSVKNFNQLFLNAYSFNQPIESWDMSSAERVRDMFWHAENFNQPLNDWDVSNVRDFAGMFNGAIKFNQPLNNWDMSSAVDLIYMFNNAHAFNQDISNWDVSKVELMGRMFWRALSFNQPLNTWDVSLVTNMSGMFYNAASFNQDLNDWDTRSVVRMDYMFALDNNVVGVFNGNISSWNTSNVEKMDHMFFEQDIFNQDISSWDVSKVSEMQYMFREADAFNSDLNSWNVGNVVNMQGMFNRSDSFNRSISNWDTANVTNMSFMFEENKAFNQDISGWCVKKIPSLPENFATGSVLQNDYYPVWDTCPE